MSLMFHIIIEFFIKYVLFWRFVVIFVACDN